METPAPAFPLWSANTIWKNSPTECSKLLMLMDQVGTLNSIVDRHWSFFFLSCRQTQLRRYVDAIERERQVFDFAVIGFRIRQCLLVDQPTTSNNRQSHTTWTFDLRLGSQQSNTRLRYTRSRWTSLQPSEQVLRVSLRSVGRDLRRFTSSSSFSWEDTTKTTSTTAVPTGSSKPVTTTWEQHWTKLDDGSGRYVLRSLSSFTTALFSLFSVPQEKFVEYVTTSDDYKRSFDRALV